MRVLGFRLAMVDEFVCSAGDPKWVVTAVRPRGDYTLFLTFGDGERRIYNALPLLEKSIYEPLGNMSFFLRARVGVILFAGVTMLI